MERYVQLENVQKVFETRQGRFVALRDINLTKIESRPSKKKVWEYVFYVDFEGHASEPRSREALALVARMDVKSDGPDPHALCLHLCGGDGCRERSCRDHREKLAAIHVVLLGAGISRLRGSSPSGVKKP